MKNVNYNKSENYKWRGIAISTPPHRVAMSKYTSVGHARKDCYYK